MGKPLDNPVGLAMRNVVEANTARSEPVVEFARKKSPSHAADAFEDHPPTSTHAATELEFCPLGLADLPQIFLPRDNTKPLVTAHEKYAREALEAYGSLRTRLLKSQASQGFRSLAITSVGKAEGKTITAFNLACCCAQVKNFTVLLIDGDLRSRSLTNLIGQLPSAGLADVISGTASYEDAVVRTDVPNLYVMGAGSSDTSPTDLFASEKWGQVVRCSAQHFKITLVDGLSMGAFADFELIAPECDGVLLVVRARSTSREALKMAVDQLDPNKLLGIVWNGDDSRNGNHFHS